MERATHILDVPIIGQRTDFACGNTALASVLQYHRVFVSADQLAELAGTTETGTDHANLVAAAQQCGLRATARSGGAIADLIGCIDRGLPVIVGWWSRGKTDKHFDPAWSLATKQQRDCGHYSVLRGYTPAKLLFMDPQDGDDGKPIGHRALSDNQFLRVWYDTDTADYHRVDRWYLLVHP